MGKMVIFLLGLLAVSSWAMNGGPVYGQQNVVDVRFTFGSDSATQIRFLAGQVHRDTSATDTAGEWKRQDNTADSCSNPEWIGRTVHPVWKYSHYELVRAVTPDSSSVTWRYEARRRRHGSATQFDPWVQIGQYASFPDVSIQDTLVMPAVRGTDWTARYGLFFVGEGEQLRACPDANANTGADSLYTRNHRLIGR